jgi:radical SAM protein with 4Fe4S-binding SPASM domain
MDCPSLVDLGYGAFSEQLHAKVSQQRLPLKGSLEVTLRCNVRCAHCYLPLAQRAGPRQGELTLAEIQRILSEVADAGCLWLLLTGGEPFLRRDFLDIYDFAKRKGFITSIFTNGTLLTESIADHLAEWRPFMLEISLYGATQATYERVTGVPGSYARCMRGIELLLERGLPLQLKTVLLTLNQDELAQMRQFSKSLGLKFRFDPVISAGIDGSLQPTQYRLRPEQIISVETQDPARARAWPKAFEDARDVEINTRQMYICGAGRKSFHIDAYGKMSICLSARNPSFDLRRGSFRQGWDSFEQSVLALEYGQAFGCARCELRTVCAQCPAVGLTELGDAEAPVPYLCQLTHLRQEVFNIPLSQSMNL